MKIIDISQRITPDTPVYPGDPPVRIRTVSSFEMGDGYEVSELTLCSHCGTHIDAPSHMICGGDTLECLPLESFFGPCRVITLTASVIRKEMLIDAQIKEGERILLRTDPQGKYPLNGQLNPCVLSLSAAKYLAAKKLTLIGIDSPSVENVEACGGEVHRILLGAGVILLEGLCLEDAPSGAYVLSAFPLHLPGENGSPCRAVLIQNEG